MPISPRPFTPRTHPRSALGFGALVALVVAGLAGCSDAHPPFAEVGVIEGFYGKPWSHQDRLDMLEFMGRYQFQTYYYAPKDDPYHRERWRDPYPAEPRVRLRELVERARELNVRFCFALSPGLSIRYSDNEDFAVLARKLSDVAEMGVDCFALFLDDVPPALQDPQDRARYESLGAAHADLANRLHQVLAADGLRLVFCPTTYTNAWGDRDYVRIVGTSMHRDIPIFWTGPDVVTERITLEEARKWGQLLGRPPLVWDNYPVNDFAPWRIFMGGLSGRVPALSRGVQGIIFNPMNQAHASMIPLLTARLYAADPSGYTSEGAAERAAEQLYGAEAAKVLAPFFRYHGNQFAEGSPFDGLFIPDEDGVDVARVQAILREQESSMAQLAEMEPPLKQLSRELSTVVTRSRIRLERLLESPHWAIQGDRLRLDTRGFETAAPALDTPVTVDGRAVEWPAAAAKRPLFGADPGSEPAQIALGIRDQQLNILVEVPDTTPATPDPSGHAWGDHIVLTWMEVDGGRRLLLLPRSPEVAAFAGERRAKGYMDRALSGEENLNFEPFFVALFEPAEVAGLSWSIGAATGGYVLEMSMPLPDGPFALALNVVDISPEGVRHQHLSPVNYPFNPLTFTRVMVAE